MFHIDLISAGGGFVIGAFTPAVGRAIKAWFVKESAVVKADAASAAKSAEAAVAKKL